GEPCSAPIVSQPDPRCLLARHESATRAAPIARSGGEQRGARFSSRPHGSPHLAFVAHRRQPPEPRRGGEQPCVRADRRAAGRGSRRQPPESRRGGEQPCVRARSTSCSAPRAATWVTLEQNRRSTPAIRVSRVPGGY